jgi:dolichol-phosphate mannosyltransferase
MEPPATAYPNTLSPRGREVERFVRFALVGASGTLVDFCVLFILKQAAGLPLVVANSASYLAGVVNNFTLNRAWTFPDARDGRVWRQFRQFLVVSTAGLILNSAIVGLLEHPLGTWLNLPETGYLVAKLLATFVVLAWNFTANRHWTFKEPR